MSRCIECWYTHGTHALACPNRYTQEASPVDDTPAGIKALAWIGLVTILFAFASLVSAVQPR